MEIDVAIAKLEKDILALLEAFQASTGREVRDIHVRYAVELPGGGRICLLSPDVMLFERQV